MVAAADAGSSAFFPMVDSGQDQIRVDHAWARRLMTEHHSFVWRLLVRLGLSAHDAEDAAQQVFMVVFTKSSLSLEGSKERAYLYGVATRVAHEFFRRGKRAAEGGEDLDRMEADMPSLEELADQHRAREVLDRVLASLPFELRAVLVLAEIDQMTKPEIADALDIPEGTAASRLRRAKELFRAKVARLSTRMSPRRAAS